MAANIDHGVILGALGSTHTDETGDVYPPTGMVIAAIQFISKNTPTALVGYNEGPRYAQNFKVEYINNSRYVHKVMTHLLKFEPYIAGV